MIMKMNMGELFIFETKKKISYNCKIVKILDMINLIVKYCIVINAYNHKK
jgi:hypothetical protein